MISVIGPAAAPLTDDVVQLLANSDWDCQWAAADALDSIASTDPTCILALVNALGHPSGVVRNAVVRALARIGMESVPYLSEVLRDGEAEEREHAADALGVIGADAVGAVGDLRVQVTCSDPDVRDWSVIALAKITGDAEFVPALLTILRLREGPNIRAQCAVALGNIGGGARCGLELLESMLQDPDEGVRAAADEAIGRIEEGP